MEAKKNKLIIIIPCLIIILLIVIVLLLNNKVKYFKEVANSTFDIIENINKEAKKIPLFNNNFNDLTLNVKESNDTTEEINSNIHLDYQNKYLGLTGSILGNNKKVNGIFTYQDEKTYFNLGNILSDNYEFNYDLTGCNNDKCQDNKYYLSELLSNTLDNINVDNSNLDSIKDLRKIVVNSFDKRYVDKRKITANKETYTRYSYVLNSYSLQKLVTKVDSDKTLKDTIFNIFGNVLSDLGITKDNFKEALLSDDTNFGTITLNVSKNKVTKVVLNIIDTIEITVNINDKNNVIEFKNESVNGSITVSKENNNIKVKLFDTNSNAIDLDMTLKSDRQVIKYGIYGEKTKVLGTLTNTINNNSNDNITGILNIKNGNMDLNIDYQFKSQDDIITKITDAKKFDDLTETEIDNAIVTLEDALDTKLVNKIMKTLKELLEVVNDNSTDDIDSDYKDIIDIEEDVSLND